MSDDACKQYCAALLHSLYAVLPRRVWTSQRAAHLLDNAKLEMLRCTVAFPMLMAAHLIETDLMLRFLSGPATTAHAARPAHGSSSRRMNARYRKLADASEPSEEPQRVYI